MKRLQTKFHAHTTRES